MTPTLTLMTYIGTVLASAVAAWLHGRMTAPTSPATPAPAPAPIPAAPAPIPAVPAPVAPAPILDPTQRPILNAGLVIFENLLTTVLQGFVHNMATNGQTSVILPMPANPAAAPAPKAA